MWSTLLENPEAIRSLFDNEPSLLGIRLTDIALSQDGPTVTLHLDLNDYPSRPPARWTRVDANAVTVSLQLLGVENFTFRGWSTENVVSWDITRQGVQLSIRLNGATVQAELQCIGIRVAQIQGYKRTA